jgi:hypothetical protein
MIVESLILAGSLAFGGVNEGTPQVNGVGVEKVELLPSVMRMALKIEAKGDTLDTALADLQKQFDELKGKLAAMNPVEGTLKMKGPELAGGGPEERMRAMQQMRQRFGRGDNAAEPEKKDGKKQVALDGTIEAEWKLTSADVVGLLRESEKIRDGVTAAIPKKAAGEKKEGASEEDEEAALMRSAQMEQGQMEAGQPVFIFVGSLDKAEVAKARQSAYAKARQSAQETADAAGGKLGALINVSSNANALNEEGYRGDYYSMQVMRQTMGMFGPQTDETQAMSPTLKELNFSVMITASFALEGAK